MSTYISYRLFTISVLILSLFILFTALSFAQETNTTETALQQRPVRTAQVKEDIFERIAEKRAEVKEKNAIRKAEFSERVEEITDEAKKAAVERINTALETINENKTTRWATALDKLSEILERIKTKLEALEAEGSDISAATELVTNAESAIASATTAVEAQAGKTYTLEIEDEQTLGQVVRSAIQQFKTDLRTTLAVVTGARDAVRQAARGLAQINAASNSSQEPETTLQNNSLTP